MRPVYVDDGRYGAVEIIVLAGIYLIFVLCALWLILWHVVGYIILAVVHRRREKQDAQAEAVQPPPYRYDWFRKA